MKQTSIGVKTAVKKRQMKEVKSQYGIHLDVRGLMMPRSCSEDAFDWLPGLGVLLRTAIPAPLQYPSRGGGFDFASGLIQMFYGFGVVSKAAGLVKLLKGVAA